MVERSIANEEFALAEGSSTEKPAIIARILGSGDDIWSVVAVVTRGRDEVGRSAAFHRYFLCRGDHKLRVILAWWEQNNRPTFNPLDQQDEGNPHIFEGEIPQPPDLEQILPLFKVQTKPQEEQRLSSSSQSAQESVLTRGTRGVPEQSGETRVIKEGIFPLSEEPVSTPESQNVEEYSLFQQLSPIVLEPNVQYDLYTINVLAINKRNSCKNGLPVCWAFDVEALVKPERFQVIKPASQKARDGINRAIAAGSRVDRNAVNKEHTQINMNPETETLLKQGIRKLIHRSQFKPQAVQTIVDGLKDKEVTSQDWETLFNQEGADIALREKIYTPHLVRLITLRALVIPHTLPEFLWWLNIQKASEINHNQRISLKLQKGIQPLFPKKQIAAGTTYLLPNLLNGKISVDGVYWLLAKSGDTIWFNARDQFISNIKDDLKLIHDHHSKKNTPDKITPKFGLMVWKSLIYSWQDIQKRCDKCQYYRPLAQLFEQLKEYALAGYFYQVSDGFVRRHLFYEIAKKQNNLPPFVYVYGLRIERKTTLDIIIHSVYGVVNFFNQDVDMKLVFVIPVSLLILGSGWLIGSRTWQHYINTNEAREYLCEKSFQDQNCYLIVFNSKNHYSFKEIQTVMTKTVDEVFQGRQKSSPLAKVSSEKKYSDITERITGTIPLILSDKTLKYRDLELSTDKIDPKIEIQCLIAIYSYQLKHNLEKKIIPQKGEECRGNNMFGLCLLGQKVQKTSIDYSSLKNRLKTDINKVMKLTFINEAIEERYWTKTKYTINEIIITTIKEKEESDVENNKLANSDPKPSPEEKTINLPKKPTLTKQLIFQSILKSLGMNEYKNIDYVTFQTDKIQQTHKRKIAQSIYKFQESQKNIQPTGYLDHKSQESHELKRKISQQFLSQVL
ncbi:hypothetical protein [Cylindrospermopsis raciborskii]|uniref:hypothetical protein n=3 Tax=Cylindrospermopsis raciborskii TaxID=77022 RepID=UPI002155B943|nr:hypothetical protein [Cylindrospermopsis raciborskii]